VSIVNVKFIGSIRVKDEGNALRAAALVKRTMPELTLIEFGEAEEFPGQYDIDLSAVEGKEMDVRRFLNQFEVGRVAGMMHVEIDVDQVPLGEVLKSYPGIARAVMELERANAMSLSRSYNVAPIYDLLEIDRFLKGLSRGDLEALVDGERDQAEEVASRHEAARQADQLLAELFVDA
jgi:hypothetical protein